MATRRTGDGAHPGALARGAPPSPAVSARAAAQEPPHRTVDRSVVVAAHRPGHLADGHGERVPRVARGDQDGPALQVEAVGDERPSPADPGRTPRPSRPGRRSPAVPVPPTWLTTRQTRSASTSMSARDSSVSRSASTAGPSGLVTTTTRSDIASAVTTGSSKEAGASATTSASARTASSRRAVAAAPRRRRGLPAATAAGAGASRATRPGASGVISSVRSTGAVRPRGPAARVAASVTAPCGTTPRSAARCPRVSSSSTRRTGFGPSCGQRRGQVHRERGRTDAGVGAEDGHQQAHVRIVVQ